MRLIDADALKKTLEKLWNIHDDDDFANKDVWREIENAPTVEQTPKWIPVSERLPEEEKDVLVTVHFDGFKDKYDNLKPGNYVEMACQNDGEWSSYSDEYKVAKSRHHVIAWMPTPEPYGGKK